MPVKASGESDVRSSIARLFRSPNQDHPREGISRSLGLLVKTNLSLDEQERRQLFQDQAKSVIADALAVAHGSAPAFILLA